jgi:hypothetical protein
MLNVPQASQMERINQAWVALGKKHGFDGMTVQPTSNPLRITAIPLEAKIATQEIVQGDEQAALEPTIEIGLAPQTHTYHLKGGVKLVIDQDGGGSLNFEFLDSDNKSVDFPLLPEYPGELEIIRALGFTLPGDEVMA